MRASHILLWPALFTDTVTPEARGLEAGQFTAHPQEMALPGLRSRPWCSDSRRGGNPVGLALACFHGEEDRSCSAGQSAGTNGDQR